MTHPTNDHPSPAAMPTRLPADTPTDPDVGGLDENDPNIDERTLAELRKNRSENANLRKRLRSVEADLETAATHLGTMRRAEVERVAAEHLVDPTDLWTSHAEVDGFLTDDGTIDATKVAEAAQAITTAKPHFAAQKNTPPPTNRPVEGLRPGASSGEKPPAPTWAGAIGSRTSAPKPFTAS